MNALTFHFVKMWTFISLLFIIISVCVEAVDDDCSRPSHMVCETKDIPKEFPATASEWHDVCRHYIPFLRCVIRHGENCKSPEYTERNSNYFLVLNDALSNAIEHCDEDNPMHSVILENLACVKPIFDDHSEECIKSFPGHKEMRKYADELRSKEFPVFTNNREERKRCLRGLYVLSCEAVMIEKNCGRPALEAFIKAVYTRTGYLTEKCNNEFKRHLFGIIDVFKPEDVSSLQADEDCNKHSYEVCRAEDLPAYFPGTEEELDEECRVYISFLECVIRTEEKCQPLETYASYPEFIKEHSETLETVLEQCDKANPNHAVVVDSLPCTKPLFDDMMSACLQSYPGHKEMKKYADALRRRGIPIFKTNKDERKECLRGIYVLSCEAKKIENNCGTDVLETYVKFLRVRVQSYTSHCNDNFKNHVPQIIDVLKEEELD